MKNVYPRNFQIPSCRRQIFQWVWPSDRLRPPTRLHTSHHSKQQVLQSSVFAKLSSLSITHQSTGILPFHQLPGVRTLYFKVQMHLQVLKRCFAPPGSIHRDLFTPARCVKHSSDNIIQTFPGNCSPASNSSASVITIQGELNVTLLSI